MSNTVCASSPPMKGYNLATIVPRQVIHQSASRMCTLISAIKIKKSKYQKTDRNRNYNRSRTTDKPIAILSSNTSIEERPTLGPKAMPAPTARRASTQITPQETNPAGAEAATAGRTVRAPRSHTYTSSTVGQKRTVRRAQSEGSSYQIQGRITEVSFTSSGVVTAGNAVHR